MIFLISLMLVSIALVAVLATNSQPTQEVAIPIRVDEDVVFVKSKLRL